MPIAFVVRSSLSSYGVWNNNTNCLRSYIFREREKTKIKGHKLWKAVQILGNAQGGGGTRLKQTVLALLGPGATGCAVIGEPPVGADRAVIVGLTSEIDNLYLPKILNNKNE
jgi:hypothetical protein